jgi:hypothetical protein
MNTDGARVHDREGHDRLLAEDERVERVAVVTEASGNEPVVGRVVHRAEKDAIEPQQPALLIELVLVLTPHRHFDDDRKRLSKLIFVNVNVVPGMHLTPLIAPHPKTFPGSISRNFAGQRPIPKHVLAAPRPAQHDLHDNAEMPRAALSASP